VKSGLTKNLEKMLRSAEIKPLGSQAFFLGLCNFGGVATKGQALEHLPK
jgi:hypothetical protein